MPSSDINYKVAIATGAKELAAGQLKRAEDQFRFATKRCPECGAGYRGLAKVFVELGDRAAALNILRDGAQALTRSGNRAEAIDLLRDAVRLAPEDHALHRRYAAACVNNGDEQAAVAEYDRYVTLMLRRDPARAQSELAYATETLWDVAGIQALADRVRGVPSAQAGAPPAGAGQAGSAQAEPAAPGARNSAPASAPTGETAKKGAAPAASPAAAAARPRQDGARPPAPAERARTIPDDPRERAVFLDERAQELLRRGDAAGPAAALEAARALFAQKLEHAAADLLLQIVAAGSTDREAQRLLVDVARSLGKGEIARDKIALLAAALRLDGRAEAATEVERLAAV